MDLRLLLIASIISVSAFSAPAFASPDEAGGIVISVKDGDTFIVSGFGTVELADVDCPEMGTHPGVRSREFALENLLNVQVFLDVDGAGQSPGGPASCVVYLSTPDGHPNLSKNFNKMVVEAGFGVVKNDTSNEFDPASW